MGKNPKEVESVSLLEPFKRYQYLLKQVADSEKIYILRDYKGELATSTLNSYTLTPAWSAVEYAAKILVGAWSEFNIVEENLDEFLETTIIQINELGYLINIFPVSDKTGFVVKPEEFVRDIEDELENYE